MSPKTGRNDPCPCGSGKKYKRCCLPRNETTARDAAAQAMLWDADGTTEFADESDDDRFDEDWASGLVDANQDGLDVQQIKSIRYIRGLVADPADLRTAIDLRTSHWIAPGIPAAILDSIDRERLDELEGGRGERSLGEPIQIDVICLETADEPVDIEVFNRAIVLLHSSPQDNEEIRRIHRVCSEMEQAPQPEAAPTTPRIRRIAAAARADERELPTSATTSLQAALKRHRQQGGTCALCGAGVTRAAAARHLTACVPSRDRAEGPAQRLATLRVTAPGFPAYWLDIEAPWEARLDAVDRFLRNLWLECCGHLSMFRIGDTDYFSAGYELDRWPGGLGFGRRRIERRMSAKLRDALPDIGERFTYDYDFGSTTRLQLTVRGKRAGNPGRAAVRLLARNTPPVWPCAVCGQSAEYMCLRCRYEDDNPFVCKTHMAEHACGEDEGVLPVVNSPRMGVCGYTG